MNVFLLLNILLVFIMRTKSETFSMNLFYEVVRSYPRENIVMSPSSVRSCLGLVYMGAEGKTASELQSVLQVKGNNKDQVGLEFERYLNKIKDSHIQMSTASRIYLSMIYEIDNDYKQRTWKYFKSEAQSVDFNDPQTANNINAWIETQTNHKIGGVVSSADLARATAVLVNAIYFKALWKTPFKKSEKTLFHMNATENVLVEMMSRTGMINYTDLPDMDAIAIELPYAQTDIRMLVILPNNIEGLPSLEKKLQHFDLTTIKLNPLLTEVQLPKFKIEFQVPLKDKLMNLGAKLIFDQGDLRGICKDRKNIEIGKIEHKAFVEIDMKGTEAAAATVAVTTKRMIFPQAHFIANHPFFFAIKDDEHIYFAGHIAHFNK